VVPKAADQPAKQLWAEVRVIQVDTAKGVAGGSSRRQVLVGLEPRELTRLPAALAMMSTGEPVLIRRGR
jgi:hypothetical protein